MPETTSEESWRVAYPDAEEPPSWWAEHTKEREARESRQVEEEKEEDIPELRLPEERETDLIRQQEDFIQGLVKHGYKEDPEGLGEDLTLEGFFNRMEAAQGGAQPSRATAPGKSTFERATKKILGPAPYIPGYLGLDGNKPPPDFDPGNQYRPALFVQNYGERLTIPERVAGHFTGKEGFAVSDVMKAGGSKPSDDSPPYWVKELIPDAPDARALMTEAEEKLKKVGARSEFEDFDPLLVTPAALQILRRDLQRWVSKDEINKIPLEYVAPVWKELRRRQQLAIKNRKPFDTTDMVPIYGTARMLGKAKSEDISVEVPRDEAEKERLIQVVRTDPTPSAQEVLINADIEGFEPLFEEDIQKLASAQTYADLDRMHKTMGFKVGEQGINIPKKKINIQLLREKNRGWGIDLDAHVQIFTRRLNRDYIEKEIQRMKEEDNLTPKQAGQAFMADTEKRIEIMSRSVYEAKKLAESFLRNRDSRSAVGWYHADKTSAEILAEVFKADAESPFAPGAPALTVDQAMKFGGPALTTLGLGAYGAAGAGDLYVGTTPYNVSSGWVGEYLRTAGSTTVGSWLTGWEPPKGEDGGKISPAAAAQSLWDHWGSKEHYEELTTGQWDMPFRFQDVGATPRKFLESIYLPKEFAAIEHLGPKLLPKTWKGEQLFGAFIGIPIMMREPDLLSTKLRLLGEIAGPLIKGKGWRINLNHMEKLDELIASDKTIKEKDAALNAPSKVLGQSWKTDYSDAQVVIREYMAARLGIQPVDIVSGVKKEIDRADANLIKAQKDYREAQKSLSKIEQDEAHLRLLQAEEQIIEVQENLAANLIALEKESLKAAKKVEAAAGASSKDLRDIPKEIKTIKALQDKWADALNTRTGAVGTNGEHSTWGDVWAIEKQYDAVAKEAVDEWKEEAAEVIGKRGGVEKVGQEEFELSEKIINLEEEITRLETKLAAVQGTGAAKGVKATEKFARDKAKHTEVAGKIEELLKVNDLRRASLKRAGKARVKVGSVAEKNLWKLYLSEPGGRLPKQYKDLLVEKRRLEKLLTKKPTKVLAGVEAKGAIDALEVQISNLKGIKNTAEQRLSKAAEARLRGRWGEYEDLIANLKPLEEGGVKTLLRVGSPAAAKNARRKAIYARVQEARTNRDAALIKLGLKPNTHMPAEYRKIGEKLDEHTIELNQLAKKAATMRVKRSLKMAQGLAAGARSRRSALNAKRKSLGLKTRTEAQEQLANTAREIKAQQQAARTAKGIWDEGAQALRDSLGVQNGLITASLKLDPDSWRLWYYQLPTLIRSKISSLMRNKGFNVHEALNAVAPEIPDYARVQLPGLNIHPIDVPSAVTAAEVSHKIGPEGYAEGVVVSPAKFREVLADRYGERALDEMIKKSKLDKVSRGPGSQAERLGMEDHPARRYVDDAVTFDELFESTEELVTLRNKDKIHLQEQELGLRHTASLVWEEEVGLTLALSHDRVRQAKNLRQGLLDTVKRGLSNRSKFFNDLMGPDVSEAVETAYRIADNMAGRWNEEVDGAILQVAAANGYNREQTIALILRYMDGESLPIGRTGTAQGSTYLNLGRNPWDAIRIGLFNDSRWTYRKIARDTKGKVVLNDKGQIEYTTTSVGDTGLMIKTSTLASLEKEGITRGSVRAKYLAEKAAKGEKLTAEELEEGATQAWTQVLKARFLKILRKEVPELDLAAFKEIPNVAFRTIARSWVPRDEYKLGRLYPDIQQEAWALLHVADSFPDFMLGLKRGMRKMYDLKLSKVEEDVRAYHIAVLAAGQAKIQAEALADFSRMVGPKLSDKDADLISGLLSGDFTDVKSGVEAVTRAFSILNRIGYPVHLETMAAATDKAARIQAVLVKMADDPSGMDAWAPTDLIGKFEGVMGNIEKELENAYLKRDADIIKDLLPFIPDILWNGVTGIVRLWRWSVVTGLYSPNPRHWTNTAVGNFGQMWITEGPAKATKLGLQALPLNIPFVGRAFQDAMTLKAKEGNRLGTLTAGIFDPRLQDFWNMPAEKAARTYLRASNGEVHRVLDLRKRAAKEGILSTFEAERGLLSPTQVSAVTGTEGAFYKFLRKMRGDGEWNRAITRMMIYGEQRTRVAHWLDNVLDGKSFKEAQAKTFDAYYDWKHGISEFERQFLTRIMTFWRWFSLASRRHMGHMGESLKATPIQLLKGETKLQRIRQQLQLARSINPLTQQESEDPYVHSVDEQYAAILAGLPPWYATDRLMWKAQEVIPGDRRLEYHDVSGQWLTHHAFIGPPITSAEMMMFYMYMAQGVTILAAQFLNEAAERIGQEPPFITPRGDLAPNWLAGVEFMAKPFVEMLLPWYKGFIEQELGGYRQSWRTRPADLGESYLIEKIGVPTLNLMGVNVEPGKNDNRYRLNSWTLQGFRLVPFFGSQIPAYMDAWIVARPDFRESWLKGIASLLGGLAGFRKVPYNPSEQLKWEMIKSQVLLKEEAERAKLPAHYDRVRFRDAFTDE